MGPGTKIELIYPKQYRGWRGTITRGPYLQENYFGHEVPHVDALFDIPTPATPKCEEITLERGEFRVLSAVDLLAELLPKR